MYQMLETVVLLRDVAEHSLRAGDLGAVVEVYGDTGVEVEFVEASGRTQAVVTLRVSDVRSVGEGDLLSVRQVRRSA
jgi:hypothetical protein